jgi:hypothetical protein
MVVMACSSEVIVDANGYVRERELTGLVSVLLDSPFLQAAEGGFGDGVIPEVDFAAYARLEAIGATEAPPRVAPVVRALVVSG